MRTRGEPLDAVSVLYPAVSHGRRGYVFRLCAVLQQAVEISVMRACVRALAPQFPILYTHLKKTFFGYVHVPATDLDVVERGEPELLLPELYATQKPAFRLYCDQNRISLDVFHANGDAGAVMRYLQALLTEYFLRLEGCCACVPPPAAAVLSDDYLRFFDGGKSISLLEKPSYRLRLAPCGDYVRYTCFSIDLQTLRAHAGQGITVNDSLTALFHRAIVCGACVPDTAPDICISVPVNLRPFFGSSTQRNFSYYVNVRLPAAVGLEESMRLVHEQVRQGTQRERLLGGIAATVRAGHSALVRYTPRAVKEWVIRRVYRAIAGRGVTTTLSNLGRQEAPENAGERFIRYEMYLGAGGGGINAAAVGCGSSVSLCLSVASQDRSIENAIASILRAWQVRFTVSEQEFRAFQKLRSEPSSDH